MKMFLHTLDVIGTIIKSKEHFWAFWDKLLSDIRQLPSKDIHVLSTCICNLVTQYKFPHPQTQEMLKIMVLQHSVQFHKARDWIHQQEQSELTYQSLLFQCKLFESQYEKYQKAKEQGRAGLMSITAATSTASSVHTDALTTQSCCNKYGYSHLPNKCPAKGQTCYACSGHNHYTTLCKQKKTRRMCQQQCRGYKSPRRSCRHHIHHSSYSPGRQSYSFTPSHRQSHSPSCSASPVSMTTLATNIPPSGTPRTVAMSS